MKTLLKASAALLTTALFGCNFSQPQPPCAVGHGGYSAKYTYVSGDTTGACARTGDIIGVQKYRQADGTQDIYLRPESIGMVPWWDGSVGTSSIDTMSYGTLTANEANEDGYCTVGTMTVASGEMNAAIRDGAAPSLSYTFTNVQFYVKDTVAGTQFSADLVISDLAGGCDATYRVDVMYPVVFCNNVDVDTDDPNYGLPLSDAESCADPENEYVDHLWSHYAASPLFDATCAPIGNFDFDYDYLPDPGVWGPTGIITPAEFPVSWHVCVPRGPVPSLL